MQKRIHRRDGMPFFTDMFLDIDGANLPRK
jgi:hypothetical protein